jgi:IPT/TIG domain
VAVKQVSDRLRRWGWVRSIGGVLTLAGTTLVFVLLILPATASAGHGPYCDGDNTIRIQNFTPNHAKAGSNQEVMIFGANFNEESEAVFIGLGKKQVEVTDWDSIGDNTIVINSIPSDATTGKLVVASSSGMDGCLAISKKKLVIDGS